ncbi:MAG: putative baseplate assembly protein [Terriglobales bacterium]
MIYRCCDDTRRRDALENQPPASPPRAPINGIDFLEVVDRPSDPENIRQTVLQVHFVLPLEPASLTAENVRIAGGERIRTITVIRADAAAASPPGDPKLLTVRVKEPGDFSTYTLRLVDPARPNLPPDGFDSVLSSVDFSFKAGCPSEFDCRPETCPPPSNPKADISYLAKDYASFRQLMLDRMATIMPQWQERNAADLGIVLVELLAYIGDYLSYEQDAVATEAYLRTARRRTSVRRHVRVVGYPMHDGRNARAWVQFQVREDVQNLKIPAGPGAQLLTRVSQQAPVLKFGTSGYGEALREKPQIFELMDDVVLFAEHNRMTFYTWGARECCLPQGTTSAYFRGRLPNLKPGMVLVLREVRGPKTGAAADADPARACAVRLTSVTAMQDPIGGLFDDPRSASVIEITKVEWADDDRLPFPLCISSDTQQGYFDGVSVALGNVALADEGASVSEQLDPVPPPNPALTLVSTGLQQACQTRTEIGGGSEIQPSGIRYRPHLKQSPLTFADPYDKSAPARAAISGRTLVDLKPAITLISGGDSSQQWLPQHDLLKSHPEDRHFVAEPEDDGTPVLRFGDDVLGMSPAADVVLAATYRVGNGAAGNVGTDSIVHVASNRPELVTDLANPVVVAVTNPLPATGGLDPEPLEEVRQRAPYAFRVQQRAVTEADYADIAQRCDPTLQRATATFRWTGSWRTAFIAADRKGGAAVDEGFRLKLERCMDQYRMAGQDVDVQAPVPVSLELEMTICVKPDYFKADVEAAMRQKLSNRALPDGTLGAFHPDNFTFGQTVYLSAIYEIVQHTDGVESVQITKFQRQGSKLNEGLKTGRLNFTGLEIPRLDNDPNFPEHGKLTLNMAGGR